MKNVKKLKDAETMDQIKIVTKKYTTMFMDFAANNLDHDTVALIIGLVSSAFVGKSITRKVLVGTIVAQLIKKALTEMKVKESE